MRITLALLAALIVCSLGVGVGAPQVDNFRKNFKEIKELAKNVDFYSVNGSQASAYAGPVRDARQRLASFLGDDLAKGAIVICSSREQKDSVSETRVKKLGYKWVLIQTVPDWTAQGMMSHMKVRRGEPSSPRMTDAPQQGRSPEQKSAVGARHLIGATVLRMSYAILMTTLDPEKEFRSSRLDDLSRSPLADWLDIGLASYASGGAALNLRFLQDHLEEVFPIEDLLTMPRPFVAPSGVGGGGESGGQFAIRMGAEGGPGEGHVAPDEAPGGSDRSGRLFAGNGAQDSFNIPKDVQDRMTFDCQAASFFSYVLQKLGMEKAQEVVRWSRDGKPAREILARAEYLGTDLDQIEKDWIDWVKNQKADSPGNPRMTSGGPPGSSDPSHKP